VPAREFFLSYLETAVAPDELLVAVQVPAWNGTGVGCSFQEISRRHGDFALAGAATQVHLADDGTVRRAVIAFCGVGATPVRVDHATETLTGRVLDDATIDEIARLSAAELDPPADVHATSAYRKHIAGVLAARTLRRARERATNHS
jgi:CO/xanthine dehydrogenase FAD-binding subunit